MVLFNIIWATFNRTTITKRPDKLNVRPKFRSITHLQSPFCAFHNFALSRGSIKGDLFNSNQSLNCIKSIFIVACVCCTINVVKHPVCILWLVGNLVQTQTLCFTNVKQWRQTFFQFIYLFCIKCDHFIFYFLKIVTKTQK